MAVKSTQEGEKLILEIDNGDSSKLNEVIEKWGFKDYQSFLRFSISIMLVTEEKFLAIKVDGVEKVIKPSSDFLK